MRQLFKTLICCALCLNIVAFPSTAVSYDDLSFESASKTTPSSYFNSPIQEITTEDHRSVRFVENTATSQNEIGTKINYSKLEDDLLALGISEREISLMTPQQFQDYANAEEILCITSYVKKDAQGYESFVSRDEALRQSAMINSSYPEDGTVSGEDDYVEMVLAILKYSNDQYKLLLTVNWLTIPEDCGKDVIGISSNGIKPNAKAGSGWLSYAERTLTSSGGTKVEYVTEYFKEKEDPDEVEGIESLAEDTLVGKGLTVRLPVSMELVDNRGETYDKYFDYSMHIEFEAEISQPNSSKRFSVIGSYLHHIRQLSYTPVLTLNPLDFVPSPDAETATSISITQNNSVARVTPMQILGLVGGMVSVEQKNIEYYDPRSISCMIEYHA